MVAGIILPLNDVKDIKIGFSKTIRMERAINLKVKKRRFFSIDWIARRARTKAVRNASRYVRSSRSWDATSQYLQQIDNR